MANLQRAIPLALKEYAWNLIIGCLTRILLCGLLRFLLMNDDEITHSSYQRIHEDHGRDLPADATATRKVGYNQ